MMAADGLAATQAYKANILLEPIGYRVTVRTYPSGKCCYQVYAPSNPIPINKVSQTEYSMQAVNSAYEHYKQTTGRPVTYGK